MPFRLGTRGRPAPGSPNSSVVARRNTGATLWVPCYVVDQMVAPSPSRAQVLPESVHAAAMARTFVARFCEEFAAESVEAARLLVCEVVTNAIRHGAGPVRLNCSVTGRLLHVEVTDRGARLPRRRYPALLEQGGRGLYILDALADRWGVEPAAEGGKTVWFDLRDR